MKIKFKTKAVLLVFFTLAAFTGCGEGGSDAHFKNASGAIVVNCTDGWTTVGSGDVVATSEGAQVKFDHDNNDNKRVCAIQGTAEIL